MKDKALDLMSACNHCTISTIGSDGKPQSAFVGFSADEDMGIIIGTYKDSRKYKNISNNSAVSIVVADEYKKIEVQYEGHAEIIDPKMMTERLILHFKKLPSSQKRLNDPKQGWLNIKPTWVRYVDANTSPITYIEVLS